ncbi:MAG: DNA replication/repair protein RecF [Mucinivorans sp.]
MYLKTLSIVNFKNCEQAELSFCPSINAFVGLNGSGKTNLLDAIYFLSLTKSGWGMSDNQCVRHESPFFVIQGNYSLGEQMHHEVVCSFKAGRGKKLKRDGKEVERMAEHIGLLPLVVSSPTDSGLIVESGQERRRYMDTFLCQNSPTYLADIMRYNSLLAERNRLLKDSIGFDDVIDIIDMQLSEVAQSIYRERCDFVERLAPVVERYYGALSADSEAVSINYNSSLAEYSMQELLHRSFERDRIMGHTTVGVHRDDLVMTIEGLPIRRYGSQGQQKSMLIALKLAQSELIAQRTDGLRPILLLDDIFDKLDGKRVENLLHIVSSDVFGQIFITDSNKVRLDRILSNITTTHRLFSVCAGVVTVEDKPQ